MRSPDNVENENTLAGIRSLAVAEAVRVTQHAQQQMTEEGVTLNDALQAVGRGEILEQYPGCPGGACCLLNTFVADGRPLHVLGETVPPFLILLAVYVPRPPQWRTPRERGSQS